MYRRFIVPYKSLKDAPPSWTELDGMKLTLEQVNWIANVYDGLKPQEDKGTIKSAAAVAIGQFKKSFEKKNDSWVKRQKGSEEESETNQTIKKKESEDIADFSESVCSFQFLEADKKGKIWDVVLIKAGFSHNNGSHGHQRFYPKETLEKKEVLKLFENAPAMAYKFEGKMQDLFDHLPESARQKNPEGFIGNQVGFFDSVKFGEYKDKAGEKAEGILARFHVAESADWLRKNLKQAWDKGKQFLGFSIDADGSEFPKLHKGTIVDWVDNIKNIIENTIVTQPAAGGQVLRLVASQTDNFNKELIMNREELIKLLQEKAPALLEGKEIEKLTESDLQKLLKEALESKEVDEKAEKEKKEKAEAEAKSKTEAEAKAIEEAKKVKTVDEKIEKLEKDIVARESKSIARESKLNFRTKLTESKLPEIIKEKLKKQYSESVLTEDEINTVFAIEQETWSKLHESLPLSESRANITSDERTKFELAMDGFWQGEDQKDADGKKVRAFMSFKEAYATIQGRPDALYADPSLIISDSYWFMPQMDSIPGLTESYNQSRRRSLMESYRVTEALVTTDWAEILGNTLNRQMMKEFANDEYSSWKKIVSSIVPVRDFRAQRRLQLGGYGVLSTVAEQGTYQALTSPGDTESTYTPAKKGGLESITMEMVANDDVGSIRMVPKKLGVAAAITIYRNVFDMIVENLEQDGSTDLCTSTRGNASGSHVALTSANLDVALYTMRQLAKYGDSINYLGSAYVPRYLVIPAELESMAMRLYKSDIAIAQTGGGSDGSSTVFNATEPNLHKGKFEPIILPYWTDATEWAVIADPKKAPTIEVGFFNGKQEPELFVQDNPTVGSVFTSDKITYKIRYIYGFGCLDYRSFYYSE